MKQELREQFRQILEKEKRYLQEQVREIDAGGLGVSLSQSVEEFSTYDQHPADVGSEVFERSKDLALREDVMLKLQAIDHALRRLEEGSYGTCEACGREIPFERLQALPYTTQCVRCRQLSEEQPHRQSVRPVEEDVLEPPYARTFNDGTGRNIYDAEDAWEELASWQEHSPHTGAGAYYGGADTGEEPVGHTEEVDQIPYEVGDDGAFYSSTRDLDDEAAPTERIDVGIQHHGGEEGLI